MALTGRLGLLALLGAVAPILLPSWWTLLAVWGVLLLGVVVDLALAGNVRALRFHRSGDTSVRLGETAHVALIVENLGRRRLKARLRDVWPPSAAAAPRTAHVDVPAGERRLRMVLGPPYESAERRVGDVACRTDRWELSLWPDLRFEALVGPDGSVLHEWLVRPEESPAPRLESVADLAPWSCVVSDVAGRFAAVEHRADTLPSRWQVAFSATESGESRSYVAHFVWGLLQTVEQDG